MTLFLFRQMRTTTTMMMMMIKVRDELNAKNKRVSCSLKPPSSVSLFPPRPPPRLTSRGAA